MFFRSATSLASALRRGVALATLTVAAAPAPAGAAPADPTANLRVKPPAECWNAGSTQACAGAAVASLNQARARMGQPAYALPPSFTALAPDRQVLVLSNLDRALYGLAPIAGVTGQLSADAAAGAHHDLDPAPSSRSYRAWTSNWAGGHGNVVYAYESWMYDDGPGSGNLDCTSAGNHGCWGHRRDVLADFGKGGGLAMGVSATLDANGDRSYAQLVVAGGAGYQPSYTYTWAQAVEDGAGASDEPRVSGVIPGTSPQRPVLNQRSATSATSTLPVPGTALRRTHAAPRIAVISRSHGTLLIALMGASDQPLRCSLRRRGPRAIRAPFRACTSLTRYRHLRGGRYMIRVRWRAGAAHLSVNVAR